MKLLLKIIFLLAIIGGIIYSIFFYSRLEAIYQENCPCIKNIKLVQYREKPRKSYYLPNYTFRIIDKFDNTKSEITNVSLTEIAFANDTLSLENKSSKFYWDCKKNRVKITKDKYLSF